jgi:hypothetical protein
VFQFINAILIEFQKCFNRKKTWEWFSRCVIGCIVRRDLRGISSMAAALKIKPELYTAMLRFFRSAAFTVEALYHRLIHLVMAHAPVMEADGRIVLLADHIKVSKEGLKMPCIQKWHQESQNSGKGEYIEGHNFGIVSMLAQAGKRIRSIPVMAEIHESKAQADGGSIIEKMARMMGKIAKTAGKGAIGVCDAYFFSKTMLNTAASFFDENGKPLLHIVTRAKKNAAGFMPIPPSGTSRAVRRGRPKMYGKKISLGTCFSARKEDFSETVMKLYNKDQRLRFLCLDLLWKPVKRTVRFILTEMNGSRFILMSSDTGLTAEQIIHLYSSRFKIEAMFDDLKNDLGGFRYHFWTKGLAKRKRGQAAAAPKNEKERELAGKAKKAIEAYVCVHIIGLGILSLLGIKESRIIWDHYSGWLRTRRTEEPSLMVTKQVVSDEYHEKYRELKRFPTFLALLAVRRSTDFLYRMA